MWNPEGESRDSRGGTSPGAVRQVSWGVWGEISQSRTGRGSRRVEGVQVSRRVEGSQHAGIAEIVSGKASFVSQLFLNSERNEPERKRQGSRRSSVSKPLTPPAPVPWSKCGPSLALPRDLWDPSIRPLVNPSFRTLLWIWNGGQTELLTLSPGLPFPRFPHLMSWLYLARRSERQGAPVLI